MRYVLRRFFILLPVATLACGTDPGNDTGVIDLTSCTEAATLPIALEVGQYRIVDPVREASCVALPASGSAQEYVAVAYSGYGTSSVNGTWADYALQSLAAGSTAGLLLGPGPRLRTAGTNSAASRFDQGLRMTERALAPQVSRGAATRLPPALVPSVGDRDSFYVCAATACTTFNRIGATVKYVGAPAIVYLDDQQSAGAEQFVAEDFVQLGQLFDAYLYAADTTAFGRESDINNDQHIAILMTPQVNALTSNCLNGRVIGYTFGKDLIPLSSHSNAREMFYTFTTSLATSSCAAVTRASALQALPSTLVHELQHMISFNQHVLQRSGVDQDIWLNEGLSHFAEELGWRTVPGSQCGGDCFPIYMGGDFGNAYAYLDNPEGEYLIAPESGDATLPERGAAWLFIRWLADHFSTDSTLGTQLTRGIEQSTVLGAARIAQLTGVGFPTLVGQWQLANWTSDLPGFPQDGLLTYRSWNYRHLFALNYPSEFDKIFPLTPDSTSARYDHPGTLYAGSGRMVRYQLPAGSPGVTIRMSGSRTNGPLSATIVPRLAIVRVQ